jgi:tetratricopeptide (TPR) repeat protein
MEIKEFETQDIGRTKIPWVICDIHRLRKSGILHIMGSNKKFGRRIYMEEGQIRFALSNQESDRLGRIMVEQGVLSEAQFTKAILKLDKKQRFGKYLVEQGLIDEARLREMLHLQTATIVLSCFELDAGLFFFEERKVNLPGDLGLDFPLGPFVVQGMRQMRNLFLVYEELEPFQDQKISMGKDPVVPLQTLPLQPDEAYAFSRVDGLSTLSQLHQISRMEKDAFHRLMLCLLCLRVLEGEREKKVEYVNRFEKPEQLISEQLPTIALAHLNRQQTADREKIISKYVEIRGKNLWEFLELSAKFSGEELRGAFLRHNKTFHPDICNADHLQDLRSHLNQIISHLNLAFNTLVDPGKRRDYIQELNKAGKGEEEHAGLSGQERLKLAEETFKMGKKFFMQEELFNAYRYLDQACKLCPEEPRYLFELALVELRNPKWAAKARAHLMKVVERAPTHGKAHFELGKLYLANNAKSQALVHFKNAAEYDPANNEAFELLEQLSNQGKGSLLDKLGRKKS